MASMTPENALYMSAWKLKFLLVYCCTRSPKFSTERSFLFSFLRAGWCHSKRQLGASRSISLSYLAHLHSQRTCSSINIRSLRESSRSWYVQPLVFQFVVSKGLLLLPSNRLTGFRVTTNPNSARSPIRTIGWSGRSFMTPASPAITSSPQAATIVKYAFEYMALICGI
jgi:hypothetical protein